MIKTNIWKTKIKKEEIIKETKIMDRQTNKVSYSDYIRESEKNKDTIII